MRNLHLFLQGIHNWSEARFACALGVCVLCLNFAPSNSYGQAPITSSGLNTVITPNGNAYNITGGTRPGGGTNLFHSFGNFSVPNNNIANFLNESALPTTNILGRVTGGNISNIFGTIQTNGSGGFGNANLFLINPAGFLFGPNATVNVGGMVAFTSADYLRLNDGRLFNSSPNAAADALLSAAPVAAFGFLGSTPGAITVQGSQIAVAPGQSISLAGGNITIQAGSLEDGTTTQPAHLSAHGGQINLASVTSPGELLLKTLSQAPNINGQSFITLGAIQVSEQSTLDVSGYGGGTVLIRGGQFVLDNSVILANVTGPGPTINGTESIGHGVDIAMSQNVVIKNAAMIDTSVTGTASAGVTYGGITIMADHVEVGGILDLETGNIVPTILQSNVLPESAGGNSGDIRVNANSIIVTNLGFIDAETGGIGNSGSILLTSTGNLEVSSGSLVFAGTTTSNPPFGNAGSIVLTSTQGDVLLTNGPSISASSQSLSGAPDSGDAGNIVVNARNGNIVLTGSPDLGPATLFSSLGAGLHPGTGGLQLNARNLTIENSGIQIDNFTPFQPGNLTVNLTGTLKMSGADIFPSTLLTTTRRNARSADLTINAQDILLTDGSTVSTETFRNGDGGTLNISTNNLQIMNGAQIRSSTRFNPFPPPDAPLETPSGSGGAITIGGLASPAGSILIDGQGSGILTNTEGTGAGGHIAVFTNSLTLQNGGLLSATTSGTTPSATGGTVTVNANTVNLVSGGTINASSTGPGNAGNIMVRADSQIALFNNGSITSNTDVDGAGGTVSLIAPLIEMQGGSNIGTNTAGSGHAGSIELRASHVDLTESVLSARTQAEGHGGNIIIRGLAGPGSNASVVTLAQNSQLVTETSGDGVTIQGNAGNILVDAARLSLSGDSLLNSASRGSTGAAGNITVNATDSLTISGSGTQLTSASREFSFGDAGNIVITSPAVVIDNGGSISTSTGLEGKAGTITVNANNFQLLSGGHITSGSLLEFPDFPPTGAAGIVAVQGLASPAQSVLIDGAGSGIFTLTQGSGAGGDISISAQSVAVQNNGHISSSSTGSGAAGNINLNAGSQLVMTNGLLTTEATKSSGGTIKITTNPSGRVDLSNSTISASVLDGTGGGGSISIDPQFVILQNSQIRANADQGPGGNVLISITNGGLFLPDANSQVTARSGNPALDGTVTIQQPIAPAGGKIQPLGKAPIQVTALLSQRCAAIARGEVSSFIVAGRDTLPTEPGGWLTSPLVAMPVANGAVIEAGETGLSSRSDDSSFLSLRRLPSPWLLGMQTFDEDWFVGC
ncbi:protein of unknown function [Nitrospira japonica]|uniref:Filamentous haemagglutinin FhaB/tRNA nuclease CdiA-like TPS domain-containing protein n=1 Tax=Nitrospira japonica TaxID=1325564 RepID=A0A1W1I7R7_9BACT|nr:filamentous hemagglutinin N-terminal domain-containing protein [Nitrospira japonica]SLM49098.1 protein of unknown function [Nitrospira japonica]